MTDSEFEHFSVAVRDMRHVKVGDHVLRKFPGVHDFESGPTVTLVVTEIDDKAIYCGPKGAGWSFDRATGMEVDHDLRWGQPTALLGRSSSDWPRYRRMAEKRNAPQKLEGLSGHE